MSKQAGHQGAFLGRTATVERIVSVDTVGGTTTISIRGELDVRSAVEAATVLVRLAKSAPARLHIDATDAPFMDSSGLAALAMVALAVTKNGGIVTMAASPGVCRVLALCGMERHFGLAGL